MRVMNMARTPHYTIVDIYNNNKGFKNSLTKAIETALREENVKIDRKILQPFLIYSLLKSYLRLYKWFTNTIFFKRGKTKFLIYSMDIFCQGESKEAWKEVKKELSGVIDEYRSRKD